MLVIQSYITKWESYSFRSAFIEVKKSEWQYWGRASIRITACSQYIPVEDLTDRILGSSSDMSLNPNTAMTLKGVPQDALHQYSLSFILNKLIEPMLDEIGGVQKPLTLHFYSSESEVIARSALRQTLERYQLRAIRMEDIHFLTEVPDYQTVYEWQEESPSECHLIVMVDFHRGVTSDKTDGAVSLLLNADDGRGVKENDVYLFRPLKAMESELNRSLTDFLAVEQVKGSENIHLWTANLDDKTSKLLIERVASASPKRSISSITSMNVCLGNISPVHIWCGVVCAVESARRQAANSLIVQKTGRTLGVYRLVRLLRKRRTTPSYGPSAMGYCYSVMGIVSSLLGFILFTDAYGGLARFGWWIVGFAVASAILALVTFLLRFYVLRNQCQDEWNMAQSRMGYVAKDVEYV